MNMGTLRTGIKCNPLSVAEGLNIINKMDGINKFITNSKCNSDLHKYYKLRLQPAVILRERCYVTYRS